jgi:predicted regulator of Ras-like GTPase activity (Roadblock/LC7/MglB family)
VGDDIPDVFSNKAGGPVVAPVAPAAPISRPAPAAPAAPAAAPAIPPTPPTPPRPAPVPHLATAPAVPQDVGAIFGQPGRKNWSPAEIVQRTAALPGVAGALIVLQDGLLVASHLPPGLTGDTIAAFLPQMYTRMSQYMKELKFGEPGRMTFVVENVPLKVYKTAGVFFAILGRADEALPEVQLDIVTAHLGPQSKQ